MAIRTFAVTTLCWGLALVGAPAVGDEFDSPPLFPLESFLTQQEPATSPFRLVDLQEPQDEPATDPSTATVPMAGIIDPTYGEEPAPVPRSTEQVFLRTQTPLLGAGQWQMDYGLTYSLTNFDFPTIHNATVVRADLRRRQLVVPLAFRFGLTDRTQLFANIPVGWRHNQLATNPLTDPNPIDLNSDHGGVGDIQLGANYLWSYGDGYYPDIILTAVGTLPTGEGFIPVSVLQGGLGNGVGALGGQVLFVHTYDPVVVFWGAGYRHYFEKTFSGINVQLGEEFTYQLGVGFAVNDRVTLSTSFLGAYNTETEFNGQGIQRASYESHTIGSAF